VYFGPSGYEVGFVSSAHSPEQLSFAAEQIKEGLTAIYQ
jgi:glutamate-1-semialdehyde 2,1-aminomutase